MDVELLLKDQKSSKMVLEDNQNETKHGDNDDKNSSDNNLKKYPAKRPFPCKICHESFFTSCSLSIHLKLHHPEENHFACNRCDEVLTGMTMWKMHVHEHIVVKPFKCTMCPSAFTETRSLNRHMTLHSQIKEVVPDKSPDAQKYECGECCKSFLHKGNLIVHMKRVHKAKLLCPLCNKSISKIQKLQIHMASKVKCKKLPKVGMVSRICGKVRTRTVCMDLYSKLHADDKPYTCRCCGERFAVPTQLKLHQQIHTGGKPFICECGKSYTMKRTMQNHLKQCKDLKESLIKLKKKTSKVRQVKKNNEEKDGCHVGKLFVENNEPLQELYKVRWKEEVDETTEFIYETYEPEKYPRAINVKPTEPLTNDPFDEPMIEPNEEPNESAEPLIDPFDDPTIEPKEEPSDEVLIEPKEELYDELSFESDQEPNDEFTEDVLSELTEEITIEPKEELYDDLSIETDEEPSDKLTKDEPNELTKQITIEPKENLNDKLRVESDEEPSDQFTKDEPSEFTKDELSDDLTVEPREKPNNHLTIESKDKQICKSTDKSFVKRISAKKQGKANKLVNKVKCKICDLCGRSFPSKVRLLKHLNWHIRAEHFPYPCAVCPKKFTAKWRFQKHMELIHGLKCKACEDSFADEDSLEAHVMEMHPELSIYPCKRCPSSFSNSHNLNKHVIKHHPDLNPLECNKCKHISGLIGHWKVHLITHLEAEKKPKPFMCDYCSRQFTFKYELKRHTLKTHNEFKSAMCGESVLDSISLRGHRNATELDNRLISTSSYICDKPGKRMINKKCLRINLKEQHTPRESTCNDFSEKLYDKIQERVHKKHHSIPKTKKEPNNELTIESKGKTIRESTVKTKKNSAKTRGKANKLAKSKICDRQFCETYLKTHMKRHNYKPKSMKCDQCGRIFLKKMKLVEHLAWHTRTESLPFHCNVCPKKFAIELSFQRHVTLIHGPSCKIINKKRLELKCETCQDSFDGEDSLEAHVMEMHPELSIYPCKRCPSSFSNSLNLKKHVIKHHPDLNPLECNKCKHISGKVGQWKVHLITHLESEKKPKPFICDYCSRKFTLKCGLMTHMKSHNAFKCAVCGESFLDRVSLRAHRKSFKHHRHRSSASSYICDACGKGLKDKKGLKAHLEKFHTPRESTCDVCGEKLFDRFQERVHQKHHIIPKPKKKPNNELTIESKGKTICESTVKSFVKKTSARTRGKANKLANKEKCKICDLQFCETYIETHMKRHKTKSMKCDQCGRSFLTKMKLVEHLAWHTRTESLPFHCNVCPKKFAIEWSFQRHVRFIHGPSCKIINKKRRELKCETCQDSFDGEDSLEAHVMEMHPELSIYPCKRCPSSFSNSHNLKNHVIKHHPDLNPFECNKCNKITVHYTDWKMHLITHLESEKKPKPYICDYCSRQFTKKGGLKKHILTHIEFKCKVCGESFLDRISLKAHRKASKHRRRSNTIYICDSCGKRLKSKDYLKFHLKKFHTPRESTCDVCGEKLFDKFQERLHQKRHFISKVKAKVKVNYYKGAASKVTCHKCGKILASKPNLKNHLRLHDNDKPCQCARCGKRFVDAARLRLHAAVHFEEKPHVCQGCGRAFSQKGNLKAHLKLCRKFVDYSEKNIATESLIRTQKVVAHENIPSHGMIIEPEKQDEAIDETVHKEDAFDVIAQKFDVEFKEETNDDPKNEVIENSPRDKTFEVGINETYKLEITIDKDEASNDGSYFDPGEHHNSKEIEHISFQNEDNETLKEGTKEEDEDPTNDTNVGLEVNLEDPLDESGEDTRRQEETSVVPVGSKPLTDKPDVNAVYQNLTCDVCDKLFKSRNTLTRHMKMHSDGKKHQCEKCGHAFHQKSNLKSHLQIHTGDKLDLIISCQSSSIGLSDNKTTGHKKLQSGERHVCLDCGKSYKAYKYLKLHMRNHTGERPYVCHACGRSFTKSGLLKVHMNTHTNEGKVECHYCGKSCASKLTLSQHMLTHGEKKHACHLCEKKFCRKDLLDAHLHRHSGIKPHKCKLCEKSFAFTINLNRHMEVHADIQPQKCEICNKVYSRNIYFKKHMRMHKKSKLKKKT